MIVVDSSIILEVLLRTPPSNKIENRIFAKGQTLHAPYLIEVEVIQVLRRYAASGALTADRGKEAIQDFIDFPISKYPHDFLLPKVWQLRRNLTAHDAFYVALAEALDTPLLTRDARLARNKSGAKIILI